MNFVAVTGALCNDPAIRHRDPRDPPAPATGRRWAWLLLAAVAILVATLRTEGPYEGARPLAPPGRFALPLADALRNVVLFVPLGVALAWFRWRLGPALLLGVAASCAIELLQLLIPGRTGSPIDVVTNGTGTALGHVAVRALPLWFSPARSLERHLVLAAGGAAAALFFATGWLFGALHPAGPWQGYFAPAKPFYRVAYPGEVVSAALDGAPLPRERGADLAVFADALRGDFQLELRIVVGETPVQPAPLLLITYPKTLHLLEIGVDGRDLTYEWKTRAKELGLEGARARWAGALARFAPGQTLALAAEVRGDDRCLVLERERRCGYGHTVGDGWRLFAPAWRSLEPYRSAGAVLWLALVCLPLGYWGRADARTAAAWGLALAGLALAPLATPLLPTPPWQYLGALSGGAAGLGLRMGLRPGA